VTEEQMLTEIAIIRRAVVDRLLDPAALATIARCPNEHVIGAVLDLAVAELESLRDPGLRSLAGGAAMQ
jgi:hypothetical protein